MIYDLSLVITSTLMVWPGDPKIDCEMIGDAVRVSRWTMGSHAGTHVDAPAHFIVNSATIDQTDPTILIGPCRVIAIPDADQDITVDALEGVNLAGVERLLIRTRNSRRWQQDTTMFDTEFVGMTYDAAVRLLAHGIRLVGVDGPSIEPYEGDGAVHRLLLRAGVVIVETLALANVPVGDYLLCCAPLKLGDADGAPARVFLLDGYCERGSV